MGNQPTRPIVTEEQQPEEAEQEAAAQKGMIPPSVSSSSLSSDSDRPPSDQEDDTPIHIEEANESEETTREKIQIEKENTFCSLVDSKEDEEEQDENNNMTERILCSMSEYSGQCIPPVLSFYRPKGPLLMRDENYRDDSEQDADDESLPRGRLSPEITCSTRRRNRSWSPKPNHRLGFLSKYSTGSSSTSSITSLLSKTKQQLLTTGYNEEERAMVDGHLSTPESDLNRLRDYFIITTACLPWMTGTAVNPLLRAASLSQYQRRQFTPDRSTVTLVVPWLEVAEDRVQLYGEDWKDKTPADQEAFIRSWLAQANMPEEALSPAQGGIRILFYPARYHAKMSSIFAMGDLCEFIVTQNNLTIPKDAVCVLEEPEHLHFYRNTNIRDHFSFVVGIIHTNYKAYASSAIPGGSLITGPLIASISSWLVRAYCDKVIKLSPVLQSFGCPEKEVVCNTHGIRQDFIREGERRARDYYQENEASQDEEDGKIYFVGKLLWQKGLDKLLELETLYRNVTGDYFPIDIYGSGPDRDDIEQAYKNAGSFFGSRYGSSNIEDVPSPPDTEDTESVAPEVVASPSQSKSRRGLAYVSTLIQPKPPVPANFMGREDHAKLTREYKIFVNPSITEVLCTTTAEATAMGKWVIIPDHPSNSFFRQFPNCLLYTSKSEFVEFLNYAIHHEPEPLRPEMIHQLTWEAATQRFIKASAITRRDAKWRERRGKTKSDETLAKIHSELGKGAKGDVIRKVLGGGPVAEQHQYERQRSQSEDPLTEDEFTGFEQMLSSESQ